MKTETKAIVASIAVIALMLTMVSGATYSWFIDIDESTVTATFGKVKYDTEFYLDDKIDNDGTINIDNIIPGESHTVTVKFTNNSNIDTKYRIYVELVSATGNGLTKYDYDNISVKDEHFNPDGDKDKIVIVGLTELSKENVGENGKVTCPITISVSKDYGSENGKPKDGWSNETERSLSFKVVVEAYQKDATDIPALS